MIRTAIGVFFIALLCGCCHHALPPTTQGAIDPTGVPLRVDSVQAMCDPPTGWRPEPLKQDERHRHQIWASPGGHTAYGVIYMSLPLPFLSAREVLNLGFLPGMKGEEGSAELVGEVQDDAKLGGIRFVARGEVYIVRGFLVTRGSEAWAVYAGTERVAPIDERELEEAQNAHDRTILGLPQ